MHSFHWHSLASPTCANIHTPNSLVAEPKTHHSSSHHYLPPDNTFSDALLSLRKCTDNKDPKMGSCFHAGILKLGLESDVFIGNSLLNMYSKFDQIKNAQILFDYMPHRTTVSWTSMMLAYHRSGLPNETILLFLRMLECVKKPNEFTLAVLLQACALKGDGNLVEAIHCYVIKTGLILDGYLQNCLLDAYSKSGILMAAEKLLQRLYSRDVVSWTCVISGCVFNGNATKALLLFCSMLEDDVLPNDVTMLTLLQACSEISNYRIMQWIHGLVLKGNFYKNGLVMNSLMEMYSTNGYFTDSMIIFCHFCFSSEGLYPSAETMASLLQGCGNYGLLRLGEEIHGYLMKNGFIPCTIAENSLINMYSKNGCKDSALLLFRTMVKRDIISWNTIIGCFVHNDQPLLALELLREIHREGSRDNVSPDFVTALTSLEACSDLALLLEGQLIHGYVTKAGLLGDTFVQNSLIDMYSKSGKLDFAEGVFKEMHERDIGSWNSIIAAYGINGKGTSALKAFADLEISGSDNNKPNAITFVNILSACAHAGLVEQGLEILNLMEVNYDIAPSMEHYACVVDLLGRAGRVEEAEAFIYEMPLRPDSDIWGTLLSACMVKGNVRIAEKAAREMEILEPSSSIWRVALSNAYAAAGEWQKVAEIRAEMRGSRELRKEGGWSSVNIDGFEFSFMAGDTKRLESSMIYEIISGLQNHMRDGIQLAV